MKLKLCNYKQSTICRLFNIPQNKYPIKPDVWQNALAGNKGALNYVLKHNIKDVEDLRKIWIELIDFKQTETTT